MVFNLASTDFPSAGLANWLTGRLAGPMKEKAAAAAFMTRHYSAPKKTTATASAAAAGEGDELRAQLRSRRVSLGI